MPYQKIRFNKRRKREYAPKTYYRHAKRSMGSAYNVASKALSLASKVNRALNVEYKDHNRYTTASATTSATWANTQLFLLNGVGQGDTSSTHDGDSYKIVGINNKCLLQGDPTNGYCNVRIMFFIYKNPQGGLPLQADLIDSSAGNAALEFRNLDNIGSYHILYDRVHNLNPTASDDTFTKYFTVNFDKEIKVRCSGTGTTYTSISENQVWCMVIGDRGANVPSFKINSRIRFVDN